MGTYHDQVQRPTTELSCDPRKENNTKSYCSEQALGNLPIRSLYSPEP